MLFTHKKYTPNLEIEHKIGIFVFIFLGILAIPLTIYGNKSSINTFSSVTRDSQPNMQIASFNPTLFGKKSEVAHIPGEIIVKFHNSVEIKTRPQVNQDARAFRISDIPLFRRIFHRYLPS